MGYDSFGLPAEQYAIQTGQHPAVTTEVVVFTLRDGRLHLESAWHEGQPFTPGLNLGALQQRRFQLGERCGSVVGTVARAHGFTSSADAPRIERTSAIGSTPGWRWKRLSSKRSRAAR